MRETVQIRCKNNGKILTVPIGSTLEEIYEQFGIEMTYGPVSAKVNNKVEGMHYRVYNRKDVEFLDLTTSSGLRTYTRTLFFVLCKAVSELYPGGHVIIDIPVSNGYFCDLQIGREVSAFDVDSIKKRMKEIIDAKMPVKRKERTTEEAIKLFRERGAESKVKLMESLGRLYTIFYEIDGYYDYFYGTLLTNTSKLHLFDLVKYYDGMLLRIPSISDPGQLGELVRQDKMFEIFKEHHRWQDILNLRTIGDLNEAVAKGMTASLINVSEALQENKIVRIAQQIAEKKTVKMVLIAGPSSSGKTTTCKRLSIQLLANGLRPIGISLDDYFVDRENTPKDEKGDYDFESLYALNIPMLNEQLNALLAGKEVELPKYNFQTGKSEKSGRMLQLKGNEVLVVEGIHALNPELTAQVPEEQKYRVYASALTTLLIDDHNYIPTTDNRLLRRIVRDFKYRGVNAQETIRRWPSVRAGENKWIFPYQENADAMFNSAMLFELAAIKQQAEPLLEQVPENSNEYSEAYRLLKFLKYINPIPYQQVPSTSLLREFLGGSSFKY
ncbi:MAG: nucleoside kinase [Prevotella sp.]|nr:nucleoside kinase [Prevotella sp.]MDD6738282.1 nucleoside kinase [Prevotella sp.]MDY6092733.1 nucleoside kinase [Prevotella sp.]